jgi:phosphoglycerate dehydrogenase-like enzyme
MSTDIARTIERLVMSTTLRVAVLDDYPRLAARSADWAVLGDSVEVTYFHDHVDDRSLLVNRLRPFDVVVAMRERTPFPGDVLRALPSLRLLVATGMHHQTIDFDAATAAGITVCGTESGPGVAATIELTWGLILALARRIADEDRAIRAGGWHVTAGPLLAGKVLGIVGLGNLGSQLPPVARALGMRVVAWSHNLTDERAAEVGVERLDHDEFFSTSDVVSVHLKLGPRSHGYVGAAEFGLMKPTALVINTSRGPVVDETALLDALHSRRIAGAALDVFDREPLPVDHPLRHAPNTLLTPHIGYATIDTYRLAYGQAVDDIAAFVRGEPVRVLNDAPRW